MNNFARFLVIAAVVPGSDGTLYMFGFDIEK